MARLPRVEVGGTAHEKCSCDVQSPRSKCFSLRKCQQNRQKKKDVSERHLMVFALKGAYSVWGLIYFDMNFCCHGIKVYLLELFCQFLEVIVV